MFDDYLNIKTIPKPKQRPRFSSKSKCVHTSRGTREFENFLKCHFLKYMRGKDVFNEPVSIDIWFFVKKSQSKLKGHLTQYPAKTPDIDNLAKSVLDAANKIVFEDDSLIVELTLHKRYETESHSGIFFNCLKMEAMSSTDKHK